MIFKTKQRTKETRPSKELHYSRVSSMISDGWNVHGLRVQIRCEIVPMRLPLRRRGKRLISVFRPAAHRQALRAVRFPASALP
jgi:hypothetical protein